VQAAVAVTATLALLGCASAVNPTDAVPAQKKALLDLAQATKYNLWRWASATGHWDTVSDPCTKNAGQGWDYVACDDNGNIVCVTTLLCCNHPSRKREQLDCACRCVPA
jgi:hypothetical protein